MIRAPWGAGGARGASKLVVYGDSNTRGTRPMPTLAGNGVLPPGEAWPGRLSECLGPGWRVTALGHPGRTFCHEDPVDGPGMDGIAALPADVSRHRRADVFAVMLGTNDLKHRFGLDAAGVAGSAGRLLDLSAELLPGARRLLIAPPPPREAGPFAGIFLGAERRGLGLAERLAEVAETRGVAFFDAGTVAETDPVDGIHLSAAAHAALGTALAPVIRSILAAQR